jgi:hypothetical protein
MMKKLEFTVEQVPVDSHHHTWVAVEKETGRRVNLPEGGNSQDGENRAGQYPEIEKYLLDQYDEVLELIYVTNIDELTIYDNGNSRWVFNRDAVVVVVNDIPRVHWSVSTGA